MLGVLTNTATVLLGSCLGMLFKRFIPQKIIDAVMIGIGLCTLYLGISGSLKGENVLITIISVVIGAIVGTSLDLDCKLNTLARKIEDKFVASSNTNSIAQGFITGSLLFCVGSMTVVGSLQAGLSGDNSMLYTKSLLDLVSSVMLASALGFGVLLSAGFVLSFQGVLVLMAGVLSPFLNDSAINEMTCVGSILIIALGLNIVGIAKFKVSNYLPAIFIAPIICAFM